MPRGGRRNGAGRSSKLDFWERLEVGAACERRFRALWKKNIDADWESRPGVDRLHYLQARFRKAAPASKARGDLSIQIENLIRRMKRIPSFVAKVGRGFTKAGPRPKGVKSEICRSVAAEFCAKWDRDDLGPRYAQRCWDEFRAVQNQDI